MPFSSEKQRFRKYDAHESLKENLNILATKTHSSFDYNFKDCNIYQLKAWYDYQPAVTMFYEKRGIYYYFYKKK